MDPNTTQPQEQNAPVTEISQTVNSIPNNEQTAPNPETAPPQPVNSQPQEPVKKKSSIFTIAVILLIIAVLALAGYILWSKYFNKVAPVQTPTPIAVVTPTATPDPTADWQTYSNPFISFRYPSGWTVTDSEGQSGFDTFHYLIDINNPKQEGPQPSTISVSYWDNAQGLDIPTFQKNVRGKPIFSSSYMAINLAGLSGYYTEDGACEPVLCKSYTLAKDNKIFIIELFEPDVTNYKQTVDQILSTVKFIEASSSSAAE